MHATLPTNSPTSACCGRGFRFGVQPDRSNGQDAVQDNGHFRRGESNLIRERTREGMRIAEKNRTLGGANQIWQIQVCRLPSFGATRLARPRESSRQSGLTGIEVDAAPAELRAPSSNRGENNPFIAEANPSGFVASAQDRFP